MDLGPVNRLKSDLRAIEALRATAIVWVCAECGRSVDIFFEHENDHEAGQYERDIRVGWKRSAD